MLNMGRNNALTHCFFQFPYVESSLIKNLGAINSIPIIIGEIVGCILN